MFGDNALQIGRLFEEALAMLCEYKSLWLHILHMLDSPLPGVCKHDSLFAPVQVTTALSICEFLGFSTDTHSGRFVFAGVFNYELLNSSSTST